MGRSIASLFTGAFLVVSSALCLAGLPSAYGDDPPKENQSPGTPPEEKKEQRIWYQLVKVNIPPDSPHRKNKDLNSPPRLFVILKKNGEQIGKRSTTQEGWSAVFERETKNQWPVREGTDDLYTIEVWDWNLTFSKMIFNITAKGEDFRKTMHEVGGELDDKNRLGSIEWKQIDTPEAYR